MSASAHEPTEKAREAAAEWCLRLSDGSLSVRDQQLFQDWLASDAAHPALFERTVVAWTVIEDQASHPELLKMRSDALSSIHKAGRRRLSRPVSLWRNSFAIAACILVLVVAGGWWWYAADVYETGIGERRVVALGDGSSISLDAATRVAVRYLNDRRELALEQGRAKFSVAKDALRPFSVKAGNRMVVATGTQFSVEKIANEVRVILYEGHVSVLDTSQPKPQPVEPNKAKTEHALEPGFQLIIPNTIPAQPSTENLRETNAPPPSPSPRVIAVDLGRSLGWEGGLIEFADEPLGSAVERMNRYGSQVLRIDDARARVITISGQFEGGNTDAFVEGVTSIFPVKAHRQADGTIELRARSP
jgi:transmembrane sensor